MAALALYCHTMLQSTEPSSPRERSPSPSPRPSRQPSNVADDKSLQPPDGNLNPRADPNTASGRRWSRWFSRTNRDQAAGAAAGNGNGNGNGEEGGPSEPASPRSTAMRERSPSMESVGQADRVGGNVGRDPETEREVQERARLAEKAGTQYVRTLRLTSDQLKQLNLKKGMNTVSFSVLSSYSSSAATCNSRIFLWEEDHSVVISDIDGTITKSDALGHVLTMIGRDWTHPGVAKLYTDITNNGFHFMYLTSRAIGQANTTREYLRGINQDGYILPDGPVIMSPDRLMTSLHREVIMRKPEVFKMACLRDIKRLFGEKKLPFYAGFGNRITDAISYRSVGVPSTRIFTIDSAGTVNMELMQPTGHTFSYSSVSNEKVVDGWFAPIHMQTAPAYTEVQWWGSSQNIADIPDLEPASPALSARSDGSRFGSVIRAATNTVTRRSSRSSLAESPGASPRLRATSATGASPLLQPVVLTEEPEEDDLGEYPHEWDGTPRKRADSMPGSLPESLELGESLEQFRIQRGLPVGEDFVRGNAGDDGQDDAEGDGEHEEGEEEYGDDDDDEEGERRRAQKHEEEEYPDLDFSAVPY